MFLSCLACLDPSLWAGTQNPTKELFAQPAVEAGAIEEGHKAVIPPVLDQWEVERVMSFLESDDDQIRALVCISLAFNEPPPLKSSQDSSDSHLPRSIASRKLLLPRFRRVAKSWPLELIR